MSVRSHKRLIIIVIALLLSISIGYAYLNTSLSLTNNLKVDTPLLYYIIANDSVMDNKSSTHVSSTTGISFSKISSSTNGQGIYTLSSTSSQTYPIHYYRGAVTNNNLLFANFCWKIVRTTDKGGIKLIYNGTPSSGQCTGQNNYISNGSFNSKINSVAYAGYMYGDVYEVNNKDMTTLMQNTYVGYDNTTHQPKYEDLTNAYFANKEAISSHFGKTDLFYLSGTSIDASEWATKYTLVSNPNGLRYTRISGIDSMSYGVKYIYSVTNKYIYYIELKGSPTIPLNTPQEALAEMTTESSNTTPSTIKETIDSWYSTNLLSYKDMLEDSVWCNDRSIKNYGGWNEANSALSTNYLYFSGRTRMINHTPSLSCTNSNDAFTVDVANGNGALDYPIGLLTADEISLAGGAYDYPNTSYYLYFSGNGTRIFTMTPSNFQTGMSYMIIRDDGSITDPYGYSAAVKPSIVLQHDTVVAKGTGTSADPYVINKQ